MVIYSLAFPKHKHFNFSKITVVIFEKQFINKTVREAPEGGPTTVRFIYKQFLGG